MPSFESTAYDLFGAKLNAAISWLNALGVATQGARFGAYKRAMAELIDCYTRRDLKAANAIFPRVATAVYEANDLIQIHAGLADQYSRDVGARLREYVSGPNAYQLESTSASSNRARNIGFELVMMARLAQAGIPLDFSVPSDVAAQFQSRSLLFECKRPQGKQKIEANVRKAFQQLEDKYRARDSLGFVAIDVSKALNPGFMLYAQPDVERMQHGLASILDQVIGEFGRHWQHRRSPKTTAVVIRFTCVGVIVNKGNMMTFCQEWALTPRDEARPEDIAAARALAAALGA